MHVDQANIHNLTSLWAKYGAKKLDLRSEEQDCEVPEQYINTLWPHRCWGQATSLPRCLPLIKQLPQSAILPIWPLRNGMSNIHFPTVDLSQIENELAQDDWHCILEQTAMFLALPGDSSDSVMFPVQAREGWGIKTVKTDLEISQWIDIVSEAFGYTIDRPVIDNLINDADLQILMASQDETPVASALIYKTGATIGIHQVGVKTDCQGKGIARRFMQQIVERCLLWGGTNIVLQASTAGKPLYESLGFQSQFLIKSYQKG